MPTQRQVLKGSLGKADSVIFKVFRCISYASAVCLVGIMLVAFFNVLGEKIIHKGIPSSSETIQYLHVPVVFLSAAYVTLDRGQTAIDLLSSKFPPLMQKIVSIFNYILGAAISGFVAYRGFVQMAKHLANHAQSAIGSSFSFPLWPFSLLFSFGFTTIALSFLWSVVRVLAPKEEVSPAGGMPPMDEAAPDGEFMEGGGE